MLLKISDKHLFVFSCYSNNKRPVALLSARATICFLDRRSRQLSKLAFFSMDLVKTVKVVVTVFQKLFIICFHSIFCIFV